MALTENNLPLKVNLNQNENIISEFGSLLENISPEHQNELQKLLSQLQPQQVMQPEKIKVEPQVNETLARAAQPVSTPASFSEIKSEAPKSQFFSEPAKKGTLILNKIGLFLDSIINYATVEEIEFIMKDYKNNMVINKNVVNYAALYYYREVDIAVCFDNRNIVREVTFGRNYKGKTPEGLRIGEPIQKAVDLYGQPDSMNETGKVCSFKWGKMTMFFENGTITHMRLNS